MLTIRKQQMEIFRREARRSFELRLSRHLQESVGDGADLASKDVAAAIEEAFKCGIRSERDIAKYCELVFRYGCGPSLGSWPKPARRLLLAHGVDAANRLTNLERWVFENQKGKQ